MKNYFLLPLISIFVFSSCLNMDNKEKEKSNLKSYHSDSLHVSFSYPENWEVRTNGNHIGLFEGLEDSTDDFQENIIIWTEDMPLEISDSLYAKAATAELKIKNPTLNITTLPSKKLGEHTYHPFEFNFTNTDSSQYHITGYTFVKGKRGYNFSCTSNSKKTQKHEQVFESIIATFKPL